MPLSTEIELLLWGMFLWSFFSFILLLVIKTRTHAFTELWAQWRKKAITIIGKKEGGGVMKIANKVRGGFSYFKEGKNMLGYILPSTGNTQIGATKYNFAIEDRGVQTPLDILIMATELKEDGFENSTQMEIAYHLRQLEKKYGTVIEKGSTIKITEKDGKGSGVKVIEMNAIDFAKKELLDLTPFAWMRAEKAGEEVEEVIYQGLHRKHQGDAFYAMRNFHKYNAPPGVIENIIASEVAASKKEQSMGLGGVSLDQLRGLAIFLLIAAVAYMMLMMTGSIDWIFSMMGGGAPTIPSPSLPSSPLDPLAGIGIT